MTYWTIMIVTILSGPMDGTPTNLLFKSPDSCEAARTLVFDALADDYDVGIDCFVSDTPSDSIRPKVRP